MFVARREIKTTNASTVSYFEGDKSRRQEVHNFQSMSTAQQGATVKLRNKKRPSENQQINNQEWKFNARRHVFHAVLSTWPLYETPIGYEESYTPSSEQWGEKRASLTSHHHVESFISNSILWLLVCTRWESLRLRWGIKTEHHTNMCTHINSDDNNAMMGLLFMGAGRRSERQRWRAKAITRKKEQ